MNIQQQPFLQEKKNTYISIDPYDDLTFCSQLNMHKLKGEYIQLTYSKKKQEY